jgi:hypothetical protein
MKKFVFGISLVVLAFGLLFTGCSDEGTGVDIETFTGTYVGKYRALVYDTDNDTMTVTVDAAANKVFFTSAILGTSFETDFDPATGRATINDLTIDTLKFVVGPAVNYAYNTTISSGYCEMRNGDTELFVQLNNCVVGSHTFGPPLEGLALTIPSVNTPNNMNPL